MGSHPSRCWFGAERPSSTAATDTTPADGYGGTADLTAYAAETTLEVAARVIDSAGSVATSPWVRVRLPEPPEAFLNLPYDVPAGSVVPMFATVTGGGGSAVTGVEFWADGTLIGTDSTAPYVARLPAARATPGDHEIAIWVDESSGRRTQGYGSSVTVGPSSSLSLSGITDGSTVPSNVTLSATWTLPDLDPSTASVSFSLGNAYAYDYDGPPWSAQVDPTETTPGLAFVQAFGSGPSASNPDLWYDERSPVLLVTVG